MSKLDKIADARAKVFVDTPARSRLEKLFDDGSFVEIDGFVTAGGKPSGVVCGYGSVNGGPVYAFAQDGGAVGKAHAGKICKIFDLALKTGVPVIGMYDSAGALVMEGAEALNAYGDMLLHINNLSGVVPQISLVLGTCAGSSAVMACSADFVVMSDNAEFFVTAPAGDASSANAAAAAKSGVAHIVKEDESSAIEAARVIVSMLPTNNIAPPPVFDFAEKEGGADVLSAACENIGTASAEEVVLSVFDDGSVVELFESFGKSVYAAMATIEGFACGVIAVKEGNKLCSNCCNKIAKLVSVWDAFQVPVITFVNTEGVDDGNGASGAVRDMAKMAHVYAEATTAKIAVITGKAYGSAYVALASKATASDYTVAWPSAVISPLAPETAVAFSYSDRITADKSREAVVAEYIENEASPFKAAESGCIDDVINPALTRSVLVAAVDLLSAKRVQKNPKKHGNIPF